jgi:hypothetical protein
MCVLVVLFAGPSSALKAIVPDEAGQTLHAILQPERQYDQEMVWSRLIALGRYYQWFLF